MSNSLIPCTEFTNQFNPAVTKSIITSIAVKEYQTDPQENVHVHDGVLPSSCLNKRSKKLLFQYLPEAENSEKDDFCLVVNCISSIDPLK